VVDSIVIMDQVQGWSHGFGFITYEEGCEGTQKAMAAILHSICNKYAEIKYPQPKAGGAAMQTPSSTTNSVVGVSGGGMLKITAISIQSVMVWPMPMDEVDGIKSCYHSPFCVN